MSKICYIVGAGEFYGELVRGRKTYHLPRCAVAICPDEALGTQDAVAFIP